ncbi:hypothetical protein BT63DRAFT_436919 [Microthyrium microscopicum]|uniref:Uncharacterized protein n=1 Tax=Microthyrium microscopicum TaxID=703497 RepID=A0A6A6ULM7_9PEZI|nr:hypothetical protein BT63DRAFT_436919 [Microthyrium microscopicum]
MLLAVLTATTVETIGRLVEASTPNHQKCPDCFPKFERPENDPEVEDKMKAYRASVDNKLHRAIIGDRDSATPNNTNDSTARDKVRGPSITNHYGSAFGSKWTAEEDLQAPVGSPRYPVNRPWIWPAGHPSFYVPLVNRYSETKPSLNPEWYDRAGPKLQPGHVKQVRSTNRSGFKAQTRPTEFTRTSKAPKGVRNVQFKEQLEDIRYIEPRQTDQISLEHWPPRIELDATQAKLEQHKESYRHQFTRSEKPNHVRTGSLSKIPLPARRTQSAIKTIRKARLTEVVTRSVEPTSTKAYMTGAGVANMNRLNARIYGTSASAKTLGLVPRVLEGTVTPVSVAPHQQPKQLSEKQRGKLPVQQSDQQFDQQPKQQPEQQLNQQPGEQPDDDRNTESSESLPHGESSPGSEDGQVKPKATTKLLGVPFICISPDSTLGPSIVTSRANHPRTSPPSTASPGSSPPEGSPIRSSLPRLSPPTIIPSGSSPPNHNEEGSERDPRKEAQAEQAEWRPSFLNPIVELPAFIDSGPCQDTTQFWDGYIADSGIDIDTIYKKPAEETTWEEEVDTGNVAKKPIVETTVEEEIDTVKVHKEPAVENDSEEEL